MSGISKRVSGSWVSSDYDIMKTSTDTLTTLPAVLYANDTTAMVGLKGNTVQNGIPTPASPVDVQGVGTLDNGQYKIPISSNSTTTPVFLGEVESTRKIKKLVLDGTEDWIAGGGNSRYIISVNNIQNYAICSHFAFGDSLDSNKFDVVPNRLQIRFNNAGYSTLEAWQTFLAQQYAAGTPVTVWYVLAEPETAVVNESLMKIGDYADTLSNVSIPVTAGGDTISVGTTVQPSEVTVNYKGWHTGAVHERDNGAWT